MAQKILDLTCQDLATFNVSHDPHYQKCLWRKQIQIRIEQTYIDRACKLSLRVIKKNAVFFTILGIFSSGWLTLEQSRLNIDGHEIVSELFRHCLFSINVV